MSGIGHLSWGERHSISGVPGDASIWQKRSVPSIGFQELPHRVTYRNDEAFHLLLRGFSHSELSVLFGFFSGCSRSVAIGMKTLLRMVDIAERDFQPLLVFLVCLEKASGCVFLVNPKSGFITSNTVGR